MPGSKNTNQNTLNILTLFSSRHVLECLASIPILRMYLKETSKVCVSKTRNFAEQCSVQNLYNLFLIVLD